MEYAKYEILYNLDYQTQEQMRIGNLLKAEIMVT